MSQIKYCDTISVMNYDKAQSELDLLASIIDRHPAGICHGSGCEGIVAEAGAQK
ncbi:hypothetical protein J1777_00825 [Comamonas denitrificans]|jgi:hypothetical protein|uniref:Uncharacterized protein n=1 Tax=Comamonas denitrificans TaxID=117506 RepID=A0A939KCA2_9BURK|nr:hypothetical protein [Comamonas denitrificans]MBO1248386.1 hypothetical protein [Comamonas denitrificans]